MGMGLGASDPVGRVFSRILEAELNVVEPGIDQRRQPRFRETDAGSDQVGIKIRRMRSGDKFAQICARKGLAPGEVEVEHPEFSSFAEDLQPNFGGKLRIRACHLQRIRAVNAVQWATVCDFRNNCEWVRQHQKSTIRFCCSCSRNAATWSRICAGSEAV